MNESKKILSDETLISSLRSLIYEAGEAILEIYYADDLNITFKVDDMPVTQADLTSHTILVNGLSNLTPSVPVVSEEDSLSISVPRARQLYWLIDPLDGTKEFIKKSDEFTVNLALIENNETIFGIVGIPALKKIYWGGKNYGSFKSLNDSKQRISASKPTDPLRVLSSKSHLNEKTQSFIDALSRPIELLQVGSSLKFLLIAEGRGDIYPRLAPTCEWDTAAAHAILEGSGGTLTQLNGDHVYYGKSDILNPHFVARGKI